MKNLKAINNNLSQTEKTSLLTEFLTMGENEKNNMRNYLVSLDVEKWFNYAKMNVTAYQVLCMVAIKNK